MDCRAIGGRVVLKDTVGKGYVGTSMGEQTCAVLPRSRTGGVAIDDVEAVKLHLCALLHGDNVVKAVLDAAALAVAVEHGTVVERVALRSVAVGCAVISANNLQRLAALHLQYVERSRLRVFIHKGVTRPQVAFKHTDF